MFFENRIVKPCALASLAAIPIAAVPFPDEFGKTLAILSRSNPWPLFISAPTRAATLRRIRLSNSHAVLHCERGT